MLSEVGHALAFGQVLPDQAIGVLVGAALPCMMRGGEIEARACGPLELRVVVELRPIVYGDGPDGMRLARNQLLRARGHHAARKLADRLERQLQLAGTDQLEDSEVEEGSDPGEEQ